jgi:hypothetical protein
MAPKLRPVARNQALKSFDALSTVQSWPNGELLELGLFHLEPIESFAPLSRALPKPLGQQSIFKVVPRDSLGPRSQLACSLGFSPPLVAASPLSQALGSKMEKGMVAASLNAARCRRAAVQGVTP